MKNTLMIVGLFKNGMIDVFGTGFDRTFKVCAQNGTEYEYQNDDFGFTFVFYRDAKIQRNDKINDKKNDKISKLDNDLIRLLSKNAYSTIPELAERTEKSEATIHRHLNVLVEKNIIERVGSRKNGYWKVIT